MVCPSCGDEMKPIATDHWHCEECKTKLEQLNLFEGVEGDGKMDEYRH